MSTEPFNEDTPNADLTENTQERNGEESAIRKKEERHTPKAAGQRLRDARSDRALTQAELAERIGVTQTAVSRYELGLDTPGGNVLQRLLTVLEINYPWYAEGSGPRDAPEHKISQEALKIAQALDTLPAAKREEIFALIMFWINRAKSKL